LDKLGDGKTPIALQNIDLDTGDRVKLGDYPLADQTYAQLLERITSKPGRSVSDGLKEDIMEYFSGSKASTVSQTKIMEQLTVLRGMAAGK
jgi:hypothetical protein